ncbi:U32 family peptidase [[Clostridium] polysaccharolyticum]|uniref:Collagenase-like protease, PrtC family n=1 Tax=[Clostridium] polysaccharolyticum TaxID=29364 RepID=A0A1I0G513_9FIRM|nr:U32 family peptidase [[Clostridium] polysaccharolyticum]SET66011.1 Collagenase-like protease, PrtC family [[Clostridium] polysaccharolyticum]
MINFAIPAMFTETQLIEIKNLNDNSKNNRRIKELYGSMPSAPVGTIRPSITLPSITTEELCDYIRKVKECGLEFDYIMNSTVLDGGEYTNEGKKEIVEFVGRLVDAGLNTITISAPYLVRLIKKFYPELNITASICAEVESVQRALDFEEIGVNCIVPAKDVNRDFKTLRNMVTACNSSIKVLCTTPCLYKCSDLYYHMNLSSVRDNSLQKALKVQGDFLSHTASRCQRRRLENVTEYIKSPWIRPEDISYYEEIGITDFKLDGRDKREEYNIEVAKAYMDGHYSGNLLYLMQNYYPKDMKEFNQIINVEVDYWKLGVYLDNSKMDGFIKYFASMKNTCEQGCKHCNYCKSWADKAITLFKKNTDQYLEVLRIAEEKNLSFE